MNDRRVIDGGGEKEALTAPQTIVFYLFIAFLGPFLRVILQLTGFVYLDRVLLSSGFYIILLVPIAYKLDPDLFQKEHWKFRRNLWMGILIAIVLQTLLESVDQLPPPDRYRVLVALFVAPGAEELARAIMIRPIAARFGVSTSVIVTAILWATLHAFFWTALAQSILLATVFLRTRRSVLCAIVVHTALNVVAVWHISIHNVLRL